MSKLPKLGAMFALRRPNPRTARRHAMDRTASARDRYERGRTLRQAKMYDQALVELRRVAQDPNYRGQAQTQVGLCLRAMGRYEEAVAALRQALHAPNLSSDECIHVLYLLGESLESLGRYAEPSRRITGFGTKTLAS